MYKKDSQPHKQYQVEPQVFDGYNKDLPVQVALGSDRGKGRREASDIRSSNWKPGVSGWRLTPTGIEFGDTSGVFPPGSITLASIQDIATAKILGRKTAGSGVIEQLSVADLITLLALVSTNISDFVEAAQDAVGNSVGVGLSYNDTTGAISVTITQYTDEMAQAAILTTAVNKLSTTTAIDAKTIATTNLYTVPAGKTAIITGAVIRVTTEDTITVVPTLGIGVAAGEADIFTAIPLTGLDATTKIWKFTASGLYVSVAAAGVIKLGIDVGATATTMTIAVDLLGYLI